jgi:hypothetical protein
MGNDIDVYCSTCFALPGELCRTKFLVYGRGEVMPVICPTHHARLLVRRRDSLHRSFATQLLAVALQTFRGR